MRAYLRGYPEYFGDKPVRDVGLIASEGRMTHPARRRHAGRSPRHPPSLLRVHPRGPGAIATSPRRSRPCDLVEGKNYFIVLTTAGGLYRYNIYDLVRCVGFHGQAPVIEFLNKGAHISSLTGEKLSEHQVIAAVQAAQHEVGLRLKSYLLLPSWGEPPYYSLLVEESDLTGPEAAERLAGAVEEHLRARNVEYASKRDTLRLGPVRTIRLPDGAWVEFQKRRLARSGGTVEQYKQPHLIPDVEAIASFRPLDPVSA